MKRLFCFLASFVAAACFAEDATADAEGAGTPEISVSDVRIFQNANTHLVTVSYELGDVPAIVTVDFLTNGVSIGEENFNNVFGAVNRMVMQTNSVHTIHWQPSKSWSGNSGAEITAKVTARDPADPPDYMSVSLGDKSVAPVSYYVSTNALPGTLADDVYRTSRLLMRRIRAANVKWRMGELEEDFADAEKNEKNVLSQNAKAHYVTFTKDFFMGVYPVTQEQYRRLTGESTLGGAFNEFEDSPIRPRTKLNFKSIRGEGSEVNHVVQSETVLHKMRMFTGIDFDLPTEAQWEYACKAGVQALLYSGKPLTSANVNELAWVWHKNPELHAVGQKMPNNWGLYDMLGNIYEWCLDKYTIDLGSEDVVDPLITEGTSGRVVRGSRYNLSWVPYVRTTYRAYQSEGKAEGQLDGYGFRVMCPLTLKFPAPEVDSDGETTQGEGE